MIPKILTLAAFALLVFACSRSGKMQRDQKQYDVVPEGSASGVTSTINGPGETPPPVTDTNADTTTNFTIPANPNPLGNDTAGTAMTGSTTTPITTTVPRPLHQRLYPPLPRPEELRPEPATDTAVTDTETTSTTTTTTTAPSTKKKSDEDQPSPPPPTDTTGTRG
ncbi:MAG TPA: hypothetical protein VF713_18090 [Thermoanaerobaculia bacterium]